MSARTQVGRRLYVADPWVGPRELELVAEAVCAGELSSRGRFVGEFERVYAEYVGVPFATSTCNGTVALHLALAALGLGPGDEVIVPALTFVAPANAARYTGATPVFVDVEPVYWMIDPARIEAAITPRTKGILVVHLYGHPCDMDAILGIADRHGLWVVEDAAEAHGATFRGQQVGGLGRIGTFSFFANKIVTTGEGGMVVTSDRALYERLLLLKNHGMSGSRRYWHEVVGFNYRMTNLQAALGVAQMERIEEFIERKRRIAMQYAEGLRGLAGVTLAAEAAWARHVYWMVCVVFDETAGWNRDALAASLEAEDIETRPFFAPVPAMPMYAGAATAFPVAERLARTGISLPSGAKLSDADVARVTDAIWRHAPESVRAKETS